MKSDIISEQLLRTMNEIDKDNHFNWLNYDVNMVDVKFNKKFNITLLISIFLGLIFGSTLVVLRDSFQKLSLKG